MPTKKELEEKNEYARLLYMSGVAQNEIAEKIGVSKPTVNKWVADGGWKEKRAAANITRPELVNKLLLTIDKLIEQVNQSEDPAIISGVGDKLSKLASVIEKLDKKANVVDAIEVFMAFGKCLLYRASFDDELSPALIKAINKYQDLYISGQIVGKKWGHNE